jgi:hypothetical protein
MLTIVSFNDVVKYVLPSLKFCEKKQHGIMILEFLLGNACGSNVIQKESVSNSGNN